MNETTLPLAQLPLTFPADFTVEIINLILVDLRNDGWTVNDPDSWTWPADSVDGDWHVEAWKAV